MGCENRTGGDSATFIHRVLAHQTPSSVSKRVLERQPAAAPHTSTSIQARKAKVWDLLRRARHTLANFAVLTHMTGQTPAEQGHHPTIFHVRIFVAVVLLGSNSIADQTLALLAGARLLQCGGLRHLPLLPHVCHQVQPSWGSVLVCGSAGCERSLSTIKVCAYHLKKTRCFIIFASNTKDRQARRKSETRFKIHDQGLQLLEQRNSMSPLDIHNNNLARRICNTLVDERRSDTLATYTYALRLLTGLGANVS